MTFNFGPLKMVGVSAILVLCGVCGFGLAMAQQDKAAADQTQKDDGKWKILEVQNAVFLLNSSDGTTYALDRTGGSHAWTEVHKVAGRLPVPRLVTRFLNAVDNTGNEAVKDSAGRVVGIRLTDHFVDSGLGFKVGDVILSVNGVPVHRSQTLNRITTDSLEDGLVASVKLRRDGEEREIELSPQGK